MSKVKGYILMELMIVVAIIGILAAISISRYQDYIVRTKATEALVMMADARKYIQGYYAYTETFPSNNKMAGIPAKEKYQSKYIASIEIEGGAIHTVYSDDTPELAGKILTMRPLIVDDSPASLMTWLCGYDEVPKGMIAIGKDKTTVTKEHLPGSCR